MFMTFKRWTLKNGRREDEVAALVLGIRANARKVG